ncbi:GP16.7-like replication protein [Bacillus phage VMY22]|uniref:Uncharacterized protein n=1 Tax=Bacillus phage VMY22 TaxID=1734382 RepID=A0A0N7GFF8_9CAUD|nr:GP16.7-like replication protein [Bacillus phage VMY22]ALH46489.1 hypothetical protein VMY22_24 [Bacillus phage VMY22]
MINIIEFLPFLLIVFIIVLFKGAHDNKKQHVVTQRHVQDNQNELNMIHVALQSQHVDRVSGLPQLTVDVLDIYDNNGIRIQADILEELSVNQFSNHTEVFAFIESQRKNWKMESSKSLPKGVVK